MNNDTRIFSFPPRTWLGRFFALLIGFVLLITAALFATIALVAGAIVAAFLIARAWWLLRKAEKRRAGEFLHAEYTVEPEQRRRIEGRPRRPDRRNF